MPRFPEYADYDALGLAALVREKKVSSLELVEAAIERMDLVDGRIQAIASRLDESARAAAGAPVAAGPFAGVPFLVKDLVQTVAGAPFRRGSRFFEDAMATEDSVLIGRHRAAGLILVGKTKTPELGLTPYTEPASQGPAKNPWDLERTPGGSSGGSAAAVAAGIVPMGHGGDGGGSIRIPASCTGLFGLKPTRGRTPGPPDVGEGWLGLAVDHAITRSVRDSAALLDATMGYAPGDPYGVERPERPYLEEVARDPGKLRIALCKTPLLPATPHPDVLAAADDVAALCASLGHSVEEAAPVVDVEAAATDLLTIISVAMANDMAEAERAAGRRARPGEFETTSRVVALLGSTISGMRLEEARRNIQILGRRMAAFYTRYDVLLTPTVGQPPPRIGELSPKGVEQKLQAFIADRGLAAVLKIPGLVAQIAKKVYAFIPWTSLANVAGLPSMSIPLVWNAAGLPIGTMFTGRFGDEATLFRLAGQLEAARPWAKLRPPTFAG
jgi:amidase